MADISRKLIFAGVLFLFIVVFFEVFLKIVTDVLFVNKKLVIIGIFSAPEYFDRRESIRNTWLQLKNDLSVKYFFLIGSLCEIPFADRFVPSTCQEHIVNVSRSSPTTFTTAKHNNGSTERRPANDFIGFGFIPKFSIVITRLGISTQMLHNVKSQAKVKLTSAYDDTELASLSFDPHENITSDIVFNTIPSLKIPQGFETRIALDVSDGMEVVFPGCDGISWNLDHGLVTIVQLVKYGHVRPKAFTLHSCSYVMMAFKMNDLEEVNNHVNQKAKRLEDWHKHKIKVEEMLREEQEKNHDIMFLNMIDVYGNLPIKLVTFLHRVTEELDFEYVLKSDDDTFVDLSKVFMELSSRPGGGHLWLWSLLREFWKVQNAGKWKEDSYNAATYPPFPCGAAYVISRAVAQYISTNRKILKMYQGEDVSLGIWLSGLLVQHHTDQLHVLATNSLQWEGTASTTTCPAARPIESLPCRWSCADDARKTGQPLCNKAQMTVADMYKTWMEFQTQGFLS